MSLVKAQSGVIIISIIYRYHKKLCSIKNKLKHLLIIVNGLDNCCSLFCVFFSILEPLKFTRILGF